MKRKCMACGLELDVAPEIENKPFLYWWVWVSVSAVCYVDKGLDWIDKKRGKRA